MKTANDLLEYEIYPNLDRAEAVSDLDPQDKGEYYLITCPQCNEREAYIYKDGYTLQCNRKDKCGYSISLWEYIKSKNNLTQQDTLKELARLSGITLPANNRIETEEIERRNIKDRVLEDFIGVCREELKKNREAQEYLKKRGFTLDEASSLGLGFYSSVNAIKTSNVNITSINGLLSDKWENRIIGLWRDRAGRPITVWGRTITEGVDPKYYYLYGEARYSPFGLDKCSKKEVIAVEGLLDALSLQKYGVTEVIALGGSSIPIEQIKSLSKAKIQAITLNLDNDTGGYEGIEKAIDKLEAENIKTYVVEPSLMGVKDPDEYIKKNGVDAYKSLLAKAQRGVEWKIELLTKRYGVTTAKGKDSILSEGTALLNRIQDAVIYDYGIKKLSSTLSMPEITIAELCEKTKETQAKEALKRDYSRLFNEAQTKLADGDIDAVETLLDEELFTLKAKKVVDKIEYFSMDKLLEEGKLYAQGGKETSIEDLDKVVKIMPKELVIVGARVRHGKSSFAYNLLLNFLENYPTETFAFFNLDVPSTILMTRLATIKAKKDRGKAYGYKDVLPCFQDVSRFPREIAEAFSFFKKCGEEKRLAIVNKPDYTVEQIIGYAEKLSQETPLGAIFLDYIELVKTASKQDTEELRIAHIVNSLRIASERLSVPVIALAQMNRATVKGIKTIEGRRPSLEGLRYSGRQEQEATTVLGLFNYNAENIEKRQEEGEIVESEKETKLEVIPLKNRGGQSNKIIELNFDMVSGYINTRIETGFNR